MANHTGVETNNRKQNEMGGFDTPIANHSGLLNQRGILKMKIRSITYFCNPNYPLDEKVLQKAGAFLSNAKSAYEAADYEVQTVRLATIPVPQLLGNENIGKLPELTS